MKNQQGFTTAEFVLTSLLLLIFIGVCWAYNLVKLTQCDFESSYRCEIIHAIGLVPAFSPITVWFDVDR